MAPEHERVFGAQRPIRHFWSAERHSKTPFSIFSEKDVFGFTP